MVEFGVGTRGLGLEDGNVMTGMWTRSRVCIMGYTFGYIHNWICIARSLLVIWESEVRLSAFAIPVEREYPFYFCFAYDQNWQAGFPSWESVNAFQPTKSAWR